MIVLSLYITDGNLLEGSIPTEFAQLVALNTILLGTYNKTFDKSFGIATNKS